MTFKRFNGYKVIKIQYLTNSTSIIFCVKNRIIFLYRMNFRMEVDIYLVRTTMLAVVMEVTACIEEMY
jgi:hypothetical protein